MLNRYLDPHAVCVAIQPTYVPIAQQALIAEAAGACAVMALERVPADIRAEGGVARMVST